MKCVTLVLCFLLSCQRPSAGAVELSDIKQMKSPPPLPPKPDRGLLKSHADGTTFTADNTFLAFKLQICLKKVTFFKRYLHLLVLYLYRIAQVFVSKHSLQIFLCLQMPAVNHKMTSFSDVGHHSKSVIPVSIPTVPQLRPVLEAISRGSSPIPPEQVTSRVSCSVFFITKCKNEMHQRYYYHLFCVFLSC